VTASATAHGRLAEHGELRDALTAVRARLGLVLLLFALAAVAWWSTAGRMAGMAAGPSADLGALGWFVGVWVVMMAAMMFPSLAPTTALYARMTRQRSWWSPLLFTSAYLLVWGLAGIGCYGLFRAGRVLFGHDLAWSAGGRWLVAGTLAAAAIYELTPLKNVCLGKCRSPLSFLLGSWRGGRLGPLLMGSKHALWCMGCCWGLMAALFALGVMNITWMAVVAGLIALEKTLPWRRAATWVTAATLVALAIAVLVAPHDVPGFVVPDGPASSMHAMGSSG
jgi:predicted metal-binding membrane protein